MIAWVLGTSLGRNLAAAGALLLAVLLVLGGVFRAGGNAKLRKLETEALRDTLTRHERMNDAPISNGASDADNRDWLRTFARKHQRR
jgi:hypothetical protein